MILREAMDKCHVRGYIARESNPDEHFWKNTYSFERLPDVLPSADTLTNDWKHYDPEGEETSVVG